MVYVALYTVLNRFLLIVLDGETTTAPSRPKRCDEKILGSEGSMKRRIGFTFGVFV